MLIIATWTGSDWLILQKPFTHTLFSEYLLHGFARGSKRRSRSTKRHRKCLKHTLSVQLDGYFTAAFPYKRLCFLPIHILWSFYANKLRSRPLLLFYYYLQIRPLLEIWIAQNILWIVEVYHFESRGWNYNNNNIGLIVYGECI